MVCSLSYGNSASKCALYFIILLCPVPDNSSRGERWCMLNGIYMFSLYSGDKHILYPQLKAQMEMFKLHWHKLGTTCTIFSVSIVCFKNSILLVYSFITSELGLLERNDKYCSIKIAIYKCKMSAPNFLTISHKHFPEGCFTFIKDNLNLFIVLLILELIHCPADTTLL
jgi:hypothetical protein